MKSLFNRSLLFLLALGTVSCFNDNSPNYQYFPDMYEPVSYEPYGEYDIFVNGQEAKLPAEGTIPRGWRPYDYENSQEGYQSAKIELTNPLPYTEDNLATGRALYTIYCAVCHGDKGDGQGILVQREKILGIPSYDDAGRDITEGSVYHVMYYGLNAMGSYASQTSIEERWLIDHYVMKLKNDLQGNSEREFDAAENQEGSAGTAQGENSNGEGSGDGQNGNQGNNQAQSGNAGSMENLTPAVNAEGGMVPNDQRSSNGGQSGQNEDQN